jgi:hypothetical protein
MSIDSACRRSMKAMTLSKPFGEIAAAALVAAGASEDAFGEDITFGGGDVAGEIAKGEFALAAGPFDFVRGNAADGAHGALADLVEIVQEVVVFHRVSPVRLFCGNAEVEVMIHGRGVVVHRKRRRERSFVAALLWMTAKK